MIQLKDILTVEELRTLRAFFVAHGIGENMDVYDITISNCIDLCAVVMPAKMTAIMTRAEKAEAGARIITDRINKHRNHETA